MSWEWGWGRFKKEEERGERGGGCKRGREGRKREREGWKIRRSGRELEGHGGGADSGGAVRGDKFIEEWEEIPGEGKE